MSGKDQNTVKAAAEELRRFRGEGDAAAQYNLGCCYDKGEGVARDAQEAAKWFRRAAKQNHALAKNALKLLQQQGIAW